MQKNVKNNIKVKAKAYNIKEVKAIKSIEEQKDFMKLHVKGKIKIEENSQDRRSN